MMETEEEQKRIEELKKELAEKAIEELKKELAEKMGELTDRSDWFVVKYENSKIIVDYRPKNIPLPIRAQSAFDVYKDYAGNRKVGHRIPWSTVYYYDWPFGRRGKKKLRIHADSVQKLMEKLATLAGLVEESEVID
jgi:hypothetical protein